MGASANNLHLRKINAIEIGEQVAGETPTREDLLENDFSSYRVVPGDVIVFSLGYQPGQPVTVDRVVDQSGFVQFPKSASSVKVFSGRMSPSIRSAYGRLLGGPKWMLRWFSALVPVHDQRLHLAAQRGILLRSDLRLLEALSQAGGILDNAQYAIVRRRVRLEGSLEPTDAGDSQEPLDLNGLLNRLEGSSNASIGASEDTFVDIDQLSKAPLPEVQPSEDLPASPWQWDMDWGAGATWQGQASGPSRTRAGPSFHRPCSSNPTAATAAGRRQSRYRDPPEIHGGAVGDGNIYIDGEIARPGPYAIPVNEPYFTLSRAITSAGGLGPLAEPDKVDLRRIVGKTAKPSFVSTWRNWNGTSLMWSPTQRSITGTG